MGNWERQEKALTEATKVTSNWNKQDLSRAIRQLQESKQTEAKETAGKKS